MPLTVGITTPIVTVGTSGTSASSGTSGASGASGVTTPATTTTTTTTTTKAVTAATTKLAWAIQLGETVYVNMRLSTGPGAWVDYRAVYLFADGNAVLVREPDCVTYTGPLLVSMNLRREGESYDT